MVEASSIASRPDPGGLSPVAALGLDALLARVALRIQRLNACRWSVRAAFGLVCAMLGLGSRLALAETLQQSFPFATFYPAVALGGLLGGFAGAAATALAAIPLVHLGVAPLDTPRMEVSLGLFLTGSVIVSGLGEWLRRSFAFMRDAEARRLAAEQSRATNESLRLAIEAGAVGTWDLDLRANAAVIGPYMSTIFGFASDARVNPDTVVALIVPEDRPRMRAAFARAVNPHGDGVYRVEYRICRATDGALRWVSARGQAFFEQGEAVRMIGIARDVTDEKTAEAALLERTRLSEQLTSVAAAAPGVIFTYRRSADGRSACPYASPNIINLLGVSAHDVALDPRPLHRRIHHGDRDALAEGLALSAAEATLWRATFRYEHPDRGWIWLEAHATPVRDADGAVSWHGYMQDVTERRRNEDALARSEARLRATIDGARDAIITVDGAGAIQSINRAGACMFGYGRDEIVGRPLRDLAPAGEDAAPLLDAERESQGRRKDGSLFPIELALTQASFDHERLFVAYVRDLSEQRRIEARLEKLHVERLAVMGGMAGSLAHELNQPLAATAAYLRVVRRLLDKPQEDRAVSVTETVEKAAAQIMRAGRILGNLRSFVGRGEPDKTIVDIHALIREALELTAASAKQARVEVCFQPAATGSTVLADGLQIKQVLVNLIRNAIEAMQDGPRRELRVSTFANGDDTLRVNVADTGAGLDDVVKAKLFEPFTTTKARGMGIGLSISQSIIADHYGHIWAEPNAGGGAVFSFTLPVAPMRDRK